MQRMTMRVSPCTVVVFEEERENICGDDVCRDNRLDQECNKVEGIAATRASWAERVGGVAGAVGEKAEGGDSDSLAAMSWRDDSLHSVGERRPVGVKGF